MGWLCRHSVLACWWSHSSNRVKWVLLGVWKVIATSTTLSRNNHIVINNTGYICNDARIGQRSFGGSGKKGRRRAKQAVCVRGVGLTMDESPKIKKLIPLYFIRLLSVLRMQSCCWWQLQAAKVVIPQTDFLLWATCYFVLEEGKGISTWLPNEVASSHHQATPTHWIHP